MTPVTIDPRHCGPPDIGQGGYVAGIVADALGGSDVVVSLRAPAPLGRPLRLECAGERAVLWDGDTMIAEGLSAPLALAVPAPPSLAEAERGSAGFDHAAHIYPGCFVCGPARAKGDGWRIFPGPLADGRVAAIWTPDDPPHVRDLWAALDCPGYFAVQDAAGKALLGRIHARMEPLQSPAGPLIIQAWPLGNEGRKHRAGTAIHGADGTLIARSEQLWVSLG